MNAKLIFWHKPRSPTLSKLTCQSCSARFLAKITYIHPIVLQDILTEDFNVLSYKDIKKNKVEVTL